MNPVVYIKIPTHIRQWAYHAYGTPVIFPVGGNEVAVIRKFTTKPPSAKLSLVEQESQTEQEAADSTKLHQSASHIFKDKEFEESRWLTHPDEYLAIMLPDSKAKPVISVLEQDVPSRRSSSTSSRWISGHRLRISLTDHAAYLPSFLHGASSMVLASIMRILCVNASTECVINTQKKALF